MVGGDMEEFYRRQGISIAEEGPQVPERNVFDDLDMETEYGNNLDPFHNIQQQLFDTFDLGDRLREETPHVFEDDSEEDNPPDVEDLEHLDDLYMEGTRSLYEGTNINTISATIVLVNMAVIHNVSNAYVDELLKYLDTVLLPTQNHLPKSHYEAKKLIRKLGLNYHIIHACPRGCVLYRKEQENLESCPKPGCGMSRYIPGSNSIPARVVRHFPLIPRVVRMFRSPQISKLLRFHYDNPNMDSSVMKSVADSPAWKYIDSEIDQSFPQECRNLRFGMALDGMNPFPHTNSTHSTWPVLMLIYNLPPYLVTKKFFIQLAL
jgi:hypothetical protein